MKCMLRDGLYKFESAPIGRSPHVAGRERANIGSDAGAFDIDHYMWLLE